MSHVYPEPSVESIPSMAEMAPYYEKLLEIASERLDGPIQTRVRSWEDGEFELRAYHGYGPHQQRPRTTFRHIVRYHARDGWSEGMETVNIDDPHDRTLIYKRELVDIGVNSADVPSKKMEIAGGD